MKKFDKRGNAENMRKVVLLVEQILFNTKTED